MKKRILLLEDDITLNDSIKKATKLMPNSPVFNEPQDEETTHNSVERFIKAFDDKFTYKGFSKENIKSLKNSIIKNQLAIEKDYVTVGIFLRVVLNRMRDMDKEKEINTPTSYFFAGCFGQDKFLWRQTKKEENEGAYYKPLIEEHYSKNGLQGENLINLK